MVGREQMQQVADGLYRLGSKHHNFYVVRDGAKATIVDSGGSKNFQALERGLGELGLGLADVEVLVITHAHTDHMGSGRRVSKAGVSVKGHEAEVPVLSGVRPISQIKPTHPALLKPAVWPFVVAMLRAGATGAVPIPDVEAVAHGEVLDVPGRPRVVHTPGHTPGHAAYYLEERQILFSGDALCTRNPLGGPTGPQLLAAPLHADVELARRSLARLGALETDLVLPGHGAPWRGPVAGAVELALGRSE